MKCVTQRRLNSLKQRTELRNDENKAIHIFKKKMFASLSVWSSTGIISTRDFEVPGNIGLRDFCWLIDKIVEKIDIQIHICLHICIMCMRLKHILRTYYINLNKKR